MYHIILEGKQVKRNQVTGMHLMAGFLLIVMGLFTWLVPNSVKQQEFDFLNYLGLAYALFGLIILIVCIAFNKKIIQTKANFTLRLLEIFSLAPILIYSLYQKWYLPAGYSAAALAGILLAYYWEKSGKVNKKATFTDNGVHIPGLGRNSHMPWHIMKRVLLRHNILTIDCTDNKLYQFPIVGEHTNIDKPEFERYCNSKIDENKNSYNKDW